MRNRVTSLISILLLSNIVFATEDPTRPPGSGRYQTQQISKKIKLQGLVIGENSWVVINDVVIREGEMKKGIKVITVKKDKVLIRRNGENIWLQWKKASIKKLTQS